MAKKPKIDFKCVDCGYIPEEDKNKSNENWKVCPEKCPKCGGKVNMEFNFK